MAKPDFFSETILTQNGIFRPPAGGKMPTELPEPRKPSKAAVAIAKGADYIGSALVYSGLCAIVAAILMLGFTVMHQQVDDVPPFGFLFLWAAVWTSASLAAFMGALIKVATGDDE